MGKESVLRAARDLLATALAAVALLALVVALLDGVSVVAVVLVPFAMLVAVLSRPEVLLLLLLLAVTVLVLALALGTLAAVFPAPVVRAARLLAERRAEAPADVLLRRRYLAGEIGYLEFRDGMIDLLKGRCARGELALGEYEAELERLLAPARHLGRSPLR
jgi:hypothetical protein